VLGFELKGGRMKVLLLSDEINQLHWSMLKSVLLVLSLLPISHFLMNLWLNAEDSSQIMIGFMAISIFSAVSIISFYSALSATVLKFSEAMNKFEHLIIKIYRYVPMLSLMSMMSYLATQI
jgi:hypothetical protein